MVKSFIQSQSLNSLTTLVRQDRVGNKKKAKGSGR